MAPGKPTFFNPDWKTHKLYKHWVTEDKKSKRRAACTKCHTSFTLGNMGISALKVHAKGEKHKKTLQNP